MDHTTFLSSLNLMTLVAVLVILIGVFVYSLRRRKNREAAARVLMDK